MYITAFIPWKVKGTICLRAYLSSYQTSMMKLFAKIDNSQNPFTIFVKKFPHKCLSGS